MSACLPGRWIVALIVAAAALAVPAYGAPRQADSHVLRLGDDVFIAGKAVRFAGETADDALLAGAEVTLGGLVGGDAAIAGREVSVTGRVREDLYAAGRDVRVSGDIGGSARIAGGTIEITDRARIADGASIAGGRIEFDGHAGSYLQLNGGRLRIDGHIEGDVVAAGGALSLGPQAVIGGRLTWRGRRIPDIAAGAQVRGGVRHLRPERPQSRWPIIGAVVLGWFIGWLLAGALLLGLLPRATQAVSDAARSRPLPAALAGLVCVFGLPLLIVLLAVTLIGIPAALLLLLAYLLLLPLGYLLCVATLADVALGRRRPAARPSTALRIGAFAITLLVAFFVAPIPVLGALVMLALVLLGTGGIALALGRAWLRPREKPPPAA